MNNELLLSIPIYADTFFQQTKARLQQTLDFQLNQQSETFSHSFLINFEESQSHERSHWWSAVPGFQASNSVSSRTHEIITSLNSTAGHWQSGQTGKTNQKLKKSMLQKRSHITGGRS